MFNSNTEVTGYTNIATVKYSLMKKLILIIVAVSWIAGVSCRAGKGCPTNGRNIGAERILSGDPKALKAANKAGKFRH